MAARESSVRSIVGFSLLISHIAIAALPAVSVIIGSVFHEKSSSAMAPESESFANKSAAESGSEFQITGWRHKKLV